MVISNPKILLADDSRFFLEIEKQFLKQTSGNIRTASNGAEVLDRVRESPPDLIYMALKMPVMDGAACCRHLKADATLKSIPVILLCEEHHDSALQICRQAGCDAVLCKPIERRSFLEAGRNFLTSIDRRETRIPCRTSIFFTIENRNLYGHTVDLSKGGIYVEFQREVRVDERLQLHFVLPGSNNEVVGALGRVAWTNPGTAAMRDDLPAGFGVEFLELTEEADALIEKFIQGSRSE